MDDYKNNIPIDTGQLKEDLIMLDNLYGKGFKTPLSDEEYDNLHSVYTSITNDTIYGDISSNANNKIIHEYPDLKGTIDKVHYITKKDKDEDENAIKAHKCLDDWIYNTYSKLNKNKDHILEFFPKFDGVSIILSLDDKGKVISAITRGDVDEGVGQDKTALFYNISFEDMIPKKYKGQKVGLKVEFIMRRDQFKKYNSKLFNDELTDERAGAVSLLNTETLSPILLKYGFVIPLLYEPNNSFIKAYKENDLSSYYIQPYGRKSIIFKAIDGYKFSSDELANIIDDMKLECDLLPVNCDGLVIRWTDEDAINTLGRNYDRNINNFEIAYKFPKAYKYTTLIDIEQNIGTMGSVSFTAIFEPIEFKGRTISRASLGSLDRMKTLNLSKGDMVCIKYDIIPYLVIDKHCLNNKSNNHPINVIDKCPYCESELILDSGTLYCGNTKCPSRIMGKIYNYCTKLKMPYIGEAIIEELYHNGILRSIKDLYNLENYKDKIIALDNFGKKTYKRLIESINNAKVKDYTLIGAIGIPNIGIKKAKKILSHITLEELLNTKDTFKLVYINGIGDKIAKSLIKGLEDNRDLIHFLLNRVKIVKDNNNKEDINICFTGFRNPKFAAYLEENYNITISDSVTKDTTLLIAKNPSSISTKITKAKELNIPIISADEAYLRFIYKF